MLTTQIELIQHFKLIYVPKIYPSIEKSNLCNRSKIFLPKSIKNFVTLYLKRTLFTIITFFLYSKDISELYFSIVFLFTFFSHY